MQKERSKRLWKIVRACNFPQIKQKIEKAQEYEKAIKASTIQKLLKCCPNFLGCFAEDELDNLRLKSFPCFLIVNVDSLSQDGSHWMALGLFADRLEIMDPLGFTIFNWTRVPCKLMNFCHRFGSRRKIVVAKRIQPDISVLCGYYCIHYVIFRQLFSFHKIQTLFSRDLNKNDLKLLNSFA